MDASIQLDGRRGAECGSEGAAGPAAVALVVQLLFAGALARRTVEVLRSADNRGRNLDVLRQVLGRLEVIAVTPANRPCSRRRR